MSTQLTLQQALQFAAQSLQKGEYLCQQVFLDTNTLIYHTFENIVYQ